MNQQQREAALRLAGLMNGAYWTVPGNESLHIEAAALLRSLAEEKQGEPVAARPVVCVPADTLQGYYPYPPDKQEPQSKRLERDSHGAFQLSGPLPSVEELRATVTGAFEPAKQAALTEAEIYAIFTGLDWGKDAYLQFGFAIEAACAKKCGVKL